MLKRVAIVVLGLAVLSAFGMPLRLPCCSLQTLSATAIQPDCCPIPGCTLAERQGPAPASIESASRLDGPIRVSVPSPAVLSAGAAGFAAPPRVFAASTSPPRGRPPTPALLSVYRI